MVDQSQNSTSKPMDEVGSGFPVKHSIQSPVQIIGHGRSGTSIFAALCRKYLGIGIATESQFIMRRYHRQSDFGDLQNTEAQRRFLESLLTERYFQRSKKFGIQLHVDDVLMQLKEPSFAGLLDATFSAVAVSLDMERWGDKSPEYILQLNVLEELFPTSQYIHVVRDGRDVAMSAKRTSNFGCNNMFCAALDWRQKIQLVRDFQATIPESRFLEIRYEDLLDDPVGTFAEVSSFLQIENKSELLEFLSTQIDNDLVRGNHTKWPSGLSSKDVEQYESLAGLALDSLGYQVTNRGDRQPNSAERLWWRIDNKLRDVVRLGYWKENFYKARLRLWPR